MEIVPVTPFPGDPTVLLAAALAGNDRALGRLLSEHEPRAYRTAYRLLRREDDARDVVQDAFLNVVRALRAGGAAPDEPARFTPWLLRVVANAALTRLRRRTKPGLRVSGEAIAGLAAPDASQPATEAERGELRRAVLRAVMALPPAQLEALTLREYEGLSYAEIAVVLGVTRGAAEMLVFRARQGFRAAYETLAARTEPPGCAALAPLLSRLLDDEVSLGTRAALTAHLTGCAHCRAELKLLRKTRRLPALIPA